jgi:hypothetical protein
MTLRAYVRCWWVNDPAVTPCPACGCPIQAPPRTSMASAMRAHYDVVHSGLVQGRSEAST